MHEKLNTTGAPADKGRILAPRRAPWRLLGGLASLFGVVVAAFGTVQTTPEPPLTQQLAVETLALSLPEPSSAEAMDFWTEERFQRGETFGSLLDRLGIDAGDVDQLRRLGGALKSLRPGTLVQARVSGGGELRTLSYLANRDQLTLIERDAGGFRISEQPAELARRTVMKSAQIRSSLFAATDAADIPDSVAAQLADVFAGDIDFHRDLRQGDRLSVVYETFAYNGREVKSGRVLAAEFVNQNRSFRAVWYSDEGPAATRIAGYYTPEGKSLRKAFLRTPLEFSRISSGFGLRMHPIQQRWRQHTGVDYAAPQGTRVKATADGVVEFAGQQGGYGNLVEIRHHSGYTTWYAHLSGFAAGLRRGARVSQGDLIGYVGQTGWATGPHLHYEFRVNNQFRNPLAIAFPAAQPLPADRIPSFNGQVEPLLTQLELLKNSNLALLQ
jgi:murein DD-endopeptidase MepM/ murein hydrolase activator NlpD